MEVLAPSQHRPVNVTDPRGFFSLMLAPDTVYCLAITPHDPHNTQHKYRLLHVAVLHLGGSAVMKGKGVKGVAEHAVFHAVRQPEHSWFSSMQRRLLGFGHQLGSWSSPDGDVVAVGHARPDMCWFAGGAGSSSLQ